MVVRRLRAELERPVDGASVAAFRVIFGLLLFISCLRFVQHGWLDEYFRAPRYFFHYWGFGWLAPLPGQGMRALYGVLTLCALCIAFGVRQRLAAAVFALGFGYAHLCDKANYLNHYYLITLLAGWCAVLPLDRLYSLRVWRSPEQQSACVRAWVLHALRFQVGVVYVFGGIGKLGSDWFLHAEPLRLWLAANVELPVLGALFLKQWLAFAFSWGGAVFDLCVVPALLCRRTRAAAYSLAVGFHGLTALLFHIGLFPWLMLGCAPLFFDPSWPRRLLAKVGLEAGPFDPSRGVVVGQPASRPLTAILAAYAAVQLLLPLRSHLYPGNTLWTEEGFRFSWKVMLMEKSGELEFSVHDSAGRTYLVAPRCYLTPFQARMAATQPDMILELAHWIAEDFRRRGHDGVKVYADAQVSFNGRPHQRFIDSNVDLATEADELSPKSWISPAPSDSPP